MKKYVCEPCGYIYDPEIGDPDNGIAPGTAFEDIPDDWVCPICFLGKEVFLESEQIAIPHKNTDLQIVRFFLTFWGQYIDEPFLYPILPLPPQPQ